MQKFPNQTSIQHPFNNPLNIVPMTLLIIQLGSVAAITLTIGEIYIYRFKKKFNGPGNQA
jgi:hypothetical protein